MNAVVYARFSSHRQGEQSIEGQVAEAQRFATAHGLTIVKVYADRAQTGRNDNREQFQLMLADAAKHAFDALIVWKTDRIGRNKEEIALNKYHLKKNGVKIYYVAEAIPDTPEGIILEAVIEGMAAYYSEQLSQNVRRGMKTSAQKGRYTGGTCPLGYRITADKRYEIDPKHAPTVREIFHLYAEGKTVTEIITILNNRGLRTARGQLFTHNSLRTLLKNKKYIGTFEYKDEVTIENSVPPIVEPEVFHRVQELLAINKKAAGHKKAKVDYLLFGKIFCGKCGAHMTGVCGTSKQHVKHHYYICSAKKKKLCTKRAVRQDWIEHLVLKHLRNLVRSEELLEFIAESTYQYYVAQNSDTSYTDSLQTALAETEKSIANLLRAIEAGIFNESTKDRMNELEEQKKELRVALAAARLKEELSLKKEHIRFFLHQFADMDYTDIDCQKRLIKIFLNSVFVYNDKVVLTFNYSEDGKVLTLHEIDGGSGHSIRIPSGFVHHAKKRTSEKDVRFFRFAGICRCGKGGRDQLVQRHSRSFCCAALLPLPLGEVPPPGGGEGINPLSVTASPRQLSQRESQDAALHKNLKKPFGYGKISENTPREVMDMKTCVIFCAAEFDALAVPLDRDDYLLAADGGLAHLRKLGLRPDGIIGDFDSLGFVPTGAEVFPVEKDDTDAMLAARKGLELGFRDFLFYGSLDGPRLDHTIANFQTLQFLADHGARGYLVGRDYLITVVKNGAISFGPEAEGILSVFCLGADARGITLRGLHYPLEDGTLTAGFPLGVSNHFTGESARIEVRDGSLLVMWDRKNGFPERR